MISRFSIGALYQKTKTRKSRKFYKNPSNNTQKVEVVIEKQIHMHLNFVDTKIKIFRDFRVFTFSPIPKNKNSEITEILQKRHETEI